MPPLNEVAFSAYARMQHDPDAIGRAFVRGVRMVMIVAMPFYMGLAATSEPLVLTMLGEKWRETAPVVHLLALAMPFMTLQVLFTPASDARGRPGIGVRNGATGAIILATAFLVGVHWGPTGMGVAWILAYPLYLSISAWRTLPVIGVRARDVAAAVAAPAFGGIAMALVVGLVDRTLPPLDAHWRLAILVPIGAAVYASWMLVFARATIREVIAIARKQPLPA